MELNYYKKSQKSKKEQGEKWNENLQQSPLFRNKDFISQESPILTDVENIVFH